MADGRADSGKAVIRLVIREFGILFSVDIDGVLVMNLEHLQ